MRNIFHLVLTNLLLVGLTTFATAQSHVTPTPFDMYSGASQGIRDSATIHSFHKSKHSHKIKELPLYMIEDMQNHRLTYRKQNNAKNKHHVNLAIASKRE